MGAILSFVRIGFTDLMFQCGVIILFVNFVSCGINIGTDIG